MLTSFVHLLTVLNCEQAQELFPMGLQPRIHVAHKMVRVNFSKQLRNEHNLILRLHLRGWPGINLGYPCSQRNETQWI